MPGTLKILIAPLDWGLGHTTRCIPLIRYLLAQGHQVIAAAEGASARLLNENFPRLVILDLQGYRVHYSSNKRGFTWHILKQVPRLLSAIRRERAWLLQLQEQYSFDLILSDNRYGIYNPHVPSAILTHQLQIQSGWGALIDRILRTMHYRLLHKFNECWIVDEPGAQNLSGILGHPRHSPRNARYLGWLSQFAPAARGNGPLLPDNEKPLVLVLLSGPEPMRSQLEQALLPQMQGLERYRFILVAGSPLAKSDHALSPFIQYYSHLNAAELAPIMQQADLLICRSGYSTLMDIAVMGKKALLIPTPGQTEQEYLARYLGRNGYFYSRDQASVHLERDIPRAMASGIFPCPDAGRDLSRMIQVTEQLLDKCNLSPQYKISG